jgi:hypothetical protein
MGTLSNTEAQGLTLASSMRYGWYRVLSETMYCSLGVLLLLIDARILLDSSFKHCEVHTDSSLVKLSVISIYSEY